MRLLLAAAAAAITLATSAHAADLVQEEPPVAIAPAAPVYIWSGPYAGAFVGYNSSNFDQSGGPDFDGEGWVGGVYGGYNFQSGNFVYGLEGDIGYSGLDAGGYQSATGGAVIADDGNAFGSLRGRVGVAYDPFLVFATGGVAVANKELSFGGASDSNTHVGYTVGAGVEAQVTDNITSRLEYRYSDYNSQDYDLGGTVVSSGFNEQSIRAGIALKF
ncbi:porin family protein [Aurantimonas sp. MSK8Z-1]|uniref:outer membrane protein n=1 Tax=Mangrovibrevibacter kandeliae TaxID=2968473 RepID=UPI0021198E9A|nr:outer membrane protein [Aurantimonas sp. MSK8Z-1]MCW4114176.1 porin family protein [Aurantimonas sp. MSK8Z-1]